jgi:hypothetical protein
MAFASRVGRVALFLPQWTSRGDFVVPLDGAAHPLKRSDPPSLFATPEPFRHVPEACAPVEAAPGRPPTCEFLTAEAISRTTTSVPDS